jgi:hypothetical protein
MTNFKILPFEKKNNNVVLIGKTGVLRITKQLAFQLQIQKQDKWIFVSDNDEKTPKKGIYLLKATNELSFHSRKMNLINGSWSLDAKPLLNEYKLKTPLKCEIELFNDDKNKGIRLLIP